MWKSEKTSNSRNFQQYFMNYRPDDRQTTVQGQTMYTGMVECYKLKNSRNFRLCFCISRMDDAQTYPQRTDSECQNDCLGQTSVQKFGHYDGLPFLRQNNLCGCSEKMKKCKSGNIKFVLIFHSKMETDKYSRATQFRQ